MSVAVIRTLKKANGGGAKITYYDNTTELGYEYVASGQDVLHPSITMPTKSGKTFIGWSTTTSENNWVGTLTANGQPMNLYAIYVPNALTVASGSVTDPHGLGWASYSGTYNSKYISGSIGCTADRAGYYIGAGDATASASFSIIFNEYQNATLSWAIGEGAGSSHDWIFDGVSTSGGSKSTTSSVHSMSTSGHCSGSDSTSTSIGITSITLSNPRAWT